MPENCRFWRGFQPATGNNRLTELPVSFAQPASLDYITVSGNPPVFPPPEILEQDAATMRAYLRDHPQP